jgi:hypothetical protein
MTTWNYRLIGDGCRFWVGEAYYDEHGQPKACTEGGVLDDWDALDELKETVTMVAEALTRPLLILGDNGTLTEDTDTAGVDEPTAGDKEAVD